MTPWPRLPAMVIVAFCRLARPPASSMVPSIATGPMSGVCGRCSPNHSMLRLKDGALTRRLPEIVAFRSSVASPSKLAANGGAERAKRTLLASPARSACGEFITRSSSLGWPFQINEPST
jgi:hypothetical protein